MILAIAERDVAVGVAVTVGVAAAAATAAAGVAVTATDVIATHAVAATTEKDVTAAVTAEAAAVVTVVVAAIAVGEGIAGTATEVATGRGQIAETEVGTGRIGEIVWVEDLRRRRGLNMTITKRIMAASTKTLLLSMARNNSNRGMIEIERIGVKERDISTAMMLLWIAALMSTTIIMLMKAIKRRRELRFTLRASPRTIKLTRVTKEGFFTITQ